MAAEGPAPIKLPYHNPGLITDLGVGLWAWPLPMDYNHDGLMDLVVVCTGVPSNGAFFFENSGQIDPQTALPVFKPGVKLGKSAPSPQISYIKGEPVITSVGAVYPRFARSAFDEPQAIPAPEKIHPVEGRIRANQWRYADYDGDGRTDVIVGIDFWGDYDWQNAFNGPKPAYNSKGEWQTGPLRGYTYVLRNIGTDVAPKYAPPEVVRTGDAPAETFGMPSPSFADFRGTGKLDLICGEFLDGFTFFENVGSRTQPRYAPGRRLMTAGKPLTMDLCMITPVACDFNGDGHVDLVVGDEDGRVAFIENTGVVIDNLPQFLPPRYFRQFAGDLKFGAISCPVAIDFDGDGLEDLLTGNTAGYIGFIKNLGGTPPRWAAPVYLAGNGKMIRIQAGENGSQLGPSEAKWGYTNIGVGDWDGDGLLDVVCNDIWGRVEWYRNVGTKTEPRLAAAQPVEVAWPGPTPKPDFNWWNPRGKELVAQWRSTPLVIDWNKDGLTDLVTVDHDGYLALFERRRSANGSLELQPGQRVFFAEGTSEYNQWGEPLNKQDGLLRINATRTGASGRRTFCFDDWDGDGVIDLFVNSRPNVNYFRGLGRDKEGRWHFKDMGPIHPAPLASHSTTPAIVHWPGRKHGDLLFSSEDGFFYFFPNPRNGSAPLLKN